VSNAAAGVRLKDREIKRQIDKKTDRKKDRQTKRQIEKTTERQKDR